MVTTPASRQHGTEPPVSAHADRPMPGVPSTTARWTRDQLWPGAVLLLTAALAWVLTLRAASMESMNSMVPESAVMFLSGWVVMMVAMMLPAMLPMVLVFRTIARRSRTPAQVGAGLAALLAGYLATWTLAGLPVYGYARVTAETGAPLTILPGLLLIAAGAYQFTSLKRTCHARCSHPLFFVTRHWRPGVFGAVRMGVLHGLDCLGCCAGLMLALIALGMMNIAWMLTAAVIIYVEKTVAGGHRVAGPLGAALLAGGFIVLARAFAAGSPLS